VWSSITPPPSELQTGVRRNVGVVPFALRRTFGSAFDFGANLRARVRATHPRWAALGPWLFGAGLSAVFAFGLYHLANAPTRPGPRTRSGPTASYAAAAAPSPAPATPSASLPSLPSREEPVATARASIAAEDDGERRGQQRRASHARPEVRPRPPGATGDRIRARQGQGEGQSQGAPAGEGSGGAQSPPQPARFVVRGVTLRPPRGTKPRGHLACAPPRLGVATLSPAGVCPAVSFRKYRLHGRFAAASCDGASTPAPAICSAGLRGSEFALLDG
jgi:hypothetical protein